MNIGITLGAYALATSGTDIVSGVRRGAASTVEVVRPFRRDRARSVARGGRLDTLSFVVEREHASVAAAAAWLISRARELRALNLAAGVTATLTLNYGGAPVVATYAEATVADGEAWQIGVRTFEPFTVSGALDDAP